jgi:hypothetical protein
MLANQYLRKDEGDDEEQSKYSRTPVDDLRTAVL